MKSSIIDEELGSSLLKLVLENSSSVWPHSGLRVIDAFSVPKYCYDATKKQFYQQWLTGRLPIPLDDASAEAAVYRDRFLLLLQRLHRDEHFSLFVSEPDYDSCEIARIQTGETKWVVGLISKLEDGRFFLGDLTASVEIDFLNARVTTGFLSENMIVAAGGQMRTDGIFQVYSCGSLPLEDRDKSRKALGVRDFFGGGTLEEAEALRLADLEKRAVNDMFVVLQDIWLDDEEVMKKLGTLLGRFNSQEVVPCLFVFMGNFCSLPCNLSVPSIRVQFGKLGQMISAHSRLRDQSRFLFIPGPDDAGPSTALPRCPFPDYLTEELRSHVPSAIFSTNPCRIKFYTQEIVFFCHDLLNMMRRSCLIPPSTEETDDDFEQLVATITHQSHLCPLPLSVQPIMWNYDHSLHLFPSPNTIVLGDKSEQKAFKYTGITCFNPGSFSSDSTFVAYRPCTQELHLSAL